VKALWVDHTPPAGFDRPELYDALDYDFIRAKLADNPIYANDAAYHRTLSALPEHLRRAFLDGDWNVFAGQYFDVFEFGRHTVRAEELRLEPWWPRWISMIGAFSIPARCIGTAQYRRQSTVNSRKLNVKTRRFRKDLL